MALAKSFIFNSYVPKVPLSSPLTPLLIFCVCFLPIIAIVASEYLSNRSEHLQPRGCRRLGLRVKSNLADQFQHRLRDSKNLASVPWKVKSLWIYPVKSCTGIELNRGRVLGSGMQYDRLFSFAQLTAKSSDSGDSTGQWKFITQREYPLLAKLKTELWVPDPSASTYSETAADVLSGGVLIITFPNPDNVTWKKLILSLLGRSTLKISIRIPLSPSPELVLERGYTLESMKIWEDCPLGLNMSKELPPQLKTFLGLNKELGLFRVSPGNEREVYRNAPRKQALGWQPAIGFTDAYPLHLLSIESVRDLASRLADEIPKLSALRFRPNIIITGPQPYAEDNWKKIRIGLNDYHVCCRTARCKLLNVDPDTGVKNNVQPWETLTSFRRIDKGAGLHPCLGMQMVPAREESEIMVGDTLHVLEETADHFYLVQ